ncbi:hypothetical protein ACFWY9_28315 [Amycolatopsis sp. NPDC059027]|uniref:hypothetical protein n=1 Tax=Amycolatopsis sp. NPDC059027 TaxID=3346709 RepID=UPI00366B4C8E
MSGRVLRLGIAVCLAAGGYVHAELYLHGYRVIPFVGPAFLVQASGSFAIAVLLVFSGSVVLRLAAAGLALGALGGFVLSRTIGVFGFVEYGLQPAPEALVSLLAEAAVLALLLVACVVAHRRRKAHDPAV